MTTANRVQKSKGIFFVLIGASMALLFLPSRSSTAQVGPAEIRNPRLKALEHTYLADLVALNQSISALKFPFKLSLNRYVGLDPKDQVGADARGLEFVTFHDRELLKVTANYNAAFNAASLTPNQRAGRVLTDVILPMLRLFPDHFKQADSFDGFGFEIGYHVNTHQRSYGYEGKEVLVVVFDKVDGLKYAALNADKERQVILNRSDIYLNGEPFGLALGTTTPYEIEALVHRPAKKASSSPPNNQQEPVPVESVSSAPAKPAIQLSAPPAAAKPIVPVPAAPAGKADIDALQVKYQPALDALNREGTAKFHFVDYAPPSFVLVRNQTALQLTMHNPQVYSQDSTSIYRRAARAFDLFLAPRLRWIVSKIPVAAEFDALNISIVNELTSTESGKSSEAVEFIFPLKETRRFTEADITNQDLINQSIVLVNGVRIALNLAQVE